MSFLQGIGDDPTPAIRREIDFAQSDSLGSGEGRVTILIGNKTSAGSLTLETVSDPVSDDQTARDLLGARSELYQGWKAAIQVDPNQTYYFYAVTEAGGGTQGTCTFTFTNAATLDTTLKIQWGGSTIYMTVQTGDTAIAQAANFVTALTNADSGSWPFTAAVGGGGSEHIVTVTAANVGDRGTLTLSRLIATYTKSPSTTCVKSAVTNGTGTDDFTTAYSTIANAGVYYYQVSAKHATSAPTSTDNGIGEHAANITTQALPINGKDQCAIFGLVGTNAQLVTVATAVNNPLCFFFWAENSPWSPMMIAAHNAAVMSSMFRDHPSANLTGYTSDARKGTVYNMPAPYAKTDIPTATEIKTALNSGGCPVTFSATGVPSLVRHVTSYSLLPSTATNDFRCREGHIPSATHAFWAEEYARRLARKQPFMASKDLAPGQRPLPNTDYPATIRGEASDLIDDMTGPKPLGKYNGPILDPDSRDAMKASIAMGTTTNGGGGHTMQAKIIAVKHNNTFEAKILESSAPQ